MKLLELAKLAAAGELCGKLEIIDVAALHATLINTLV